MKMSRRPFLILAALLLLSLVAQPVWALTDEELFRDFQFNFLNPGGRAQGLGGAFIAGADDATAAETNPAALNRVFTQELFLEYRQQNWNNRLQTTSPGLTQDLLSYEIFTEREDSSFLSFASYALPMRIGQRRVVLAFSRQVMLDTRNTLPTGSTTLDFSSADFPLIVENGMIRRASIESSVSGQLDVDLEKYNLGFSYELTDHFSIGATGSYSQLDMKGLLVNSVVDPRGLLNPINPRRVMPGTGAVNFLSRSTLDDNDSAFSYTVGVHWHPDKAFPGRKEISPITLGFVYRKGADLLVQENVSELDAGSPLCAGGPLASCPELPLGQRMVDVSLKVPDRFGIGAAFNATNRWTLVADVERILYSDLLDNYQTNVNLFTSPVLGGGLSTGDLTQVTADDFTVDDATVIRLGAEYAFTSRGRWQHAIRVGYFNAPDNKIRLQNADTGDAALDETLLDLFRGGEDQDHYTVGFSLNAPGGFSIQAAGNFSDDSEEYVISTIYRFGSVR